MYLPCGLTYVLFKKKKYISRMCSNNLIFSINEIWKWFNDLCVFIHLWDVKKIIFYKFDI